MKPGELDGVDPDFLARHREWITWLTHTWFRADVHGMELLPDRPFLGVGNHSGAAMIPDTLVWLGAYHTEDRQPPLVTLAHDQLFDAYPEKLAWALTKLGGVRARRELALEAFRRGYAVQVYPGGDHDACRPFSQRGKIVFGGRKGYVELAREANVPIVPVVSVGGHEALVILTRGTKLAKWLGVDRRFRLKALPLSLSVPWGLWLGPLPGYLPLPTKIVVKVLPSIDPHQGDVDEVDARVRGALQRAADELMQQRRFPWLG